MRSRDPEPEQQFPWGGIAAAAFAVAGILVGWRTCASAPSMRPTSSGSPESSASAAPSAVAPAASAAADAPPSEGERPGPPRCTEIASDALVIGEPPAAPRPAAPPSDSPIPMPEEPDDYLAPFAVEVGRGTLYEGGFAAGALRDAEGGTVAMIATLGLDGKNGKLVRLARSRGDLEPPVVAGAGASVLVALLEPNASGRAIKIAKVTGGEVTWGVELSEGRDESLAMDLATSGERAILVWDDVLTEGKRSAIVLASFDTASLRSVTRPRPVSPPSVDADSPRVVARPGGYWLAYVAQAVARDAAGSPRRAKDAKGSSQNRDTAAAGETISHRWIEAMPLDETGAPIATPRAITPKDGHVLAFDMELGEDGAAIVAFRDDDTPSGSSGGRVSMVVVRPSGEGEPRVVAEEGVGAGVPDLLLGWLSIASLSGPPRLAAMTPAGELDGALSPEPALAAGSEPIAAAKGALLVARPAGKAMKLSVLKCVPGEPAPPIADAGADPTADAGLEPAPSP